MDLTGESVSGAKSALWIDLAKLAISSCVDWANFDQYRWPVAALTTERAAIAVAFSDDGGYDFRPDLARNLEC
jgi:hypothetical protein